MRDECLAPPLLIAVQVDSVSVAKILLENGAKMSVKDGYFNEGVLHLAACHSCIDMFELLRDHINCHVGPQDLNSAGHTPLQEFDNERPKYQNENNGPHL